jgi:DNA-binding CsgD family transcriptional regulator
MDGAVWCVEREQRAPGPSRRLADLEAFGFGAAALAALDRLSQGMLLISRAQRVCFANRSARAICTAHASLQLRRDELLASSREQGALLRRALVRASAQGVGGSLRLTSGSRERPLAVLIAPLPLPTAGVGPDAPTTMLLVSDPAHNTTPPKERLMQAYGLTAAEATLARLLVGGTDLSAIARELGIRIATARTHLRQVLAKTGAHRQCELVGQLLREVGGLI